MRRFREAQTVAEEALTIRRELAETELDRHRPDLASSLYNVAIAKRATREPDAALDDLRDAVAVRKARTEREPELHGPRYQQFLEELRAGLELASRHK